MERAKCNNQDTNIWYPETDDPEYKSKVAEAVKICNSCEVHKECLVYAIRMNDMDGIWGGKTPTERRKIKYEVGI